METKKSTISKVTGNGKWDSANGTLYKFEVEFMNGDIGGVMTKELDQKKWVVGEEVEYTKEVKGNFTNFKKVDAKPAGFKSNYNPEADAKKQIMIILQSCLSQSNQFHTINGYSEKAKDIGGKLKETYATTEWFAKQILGSSLLNQPKEDLRNSTKPFVESKPQGRAPVESSIDNLNAQDDLPF